MLTSLPLFQILLHSFSLFPLFLSDVLNFSIVHLEFSWTLNVTCNLLSLILCGKEGLDRHAVSVLPILSTLSYSLTVGLFFSLNELVQICFCGLFTNQLLPGEIHKGYTTVSNKNQNTFQPWSSTSLWNFIKRGTWNFW